MKKLVIIAAAGFFALASCKKEYTCECTSSYNGTSSTSSSTATGTKKNVKKACEANTMNVGNTAIVCHLKD